MKLSQNDNFGLKDLYVCISCLFKIYAIYSVMSVLVHIVKKIMNSGKGIFEGYFPQHTSAIFLADVTIYL